MCGFVAGIFPKGSEPDEAAVGRALDAIGHRGPDGRGTLRLDLGDRIAVLGHVRLALVGVDDGAQPLVSEGAALVVNGEFYGHRESRHALEARGRRFATASDSEVALHAHALAAPGSDGWLAGLRGEWALALVDRRTATLTAACDPAGVRPLRHWSSPDGRTVVVASEAKALFALGVPRALDEATLRFAMEFQYLPFGRTLFEGVGMLPPGCRLDVGDGGTRIRPWYDPVRSDVLPGGAIDWFAPDEAEAVARASAGGRRERTHALRLLLANAVRRHVPDEVSFATHLSGGLDSAVVTALLGTEAGRPGVDAFCAAFPWGADEVDDARVTARALGARLVPVAMEPRRLVEAMDVAARHAEGMAINAHAGAKVIIAEALRAAGHKCAFTGEGADETFLGYEHIRLDFPVASRPTSSDVNAATLGVHRPDGSDTALDAVGVSVGFVPTFVRAKASAAGALRPAYGERLRPVPFDPGRIVGDLPGPWRDSLAALAPPEVSRALWSVYAMSGYILRGLDDACGMARAVESRLAFLDPAVRRFAATLPPHEHYATDGLEKGLLREAMADLLPPEVLARPKRPFMGPSLLDTPDGEAWARERLLDGGLHRSGLFTRHGLESLLRSAPRPARESGVLALASLSTLVDAFDLA